MKRFILYISLSLAFSSLCAQLNLGHEVIASSGGDLSSGGLHFSSTLGEEVTQTLQSGTLVLTQGFQQGPQALANSLDEWESLVKDYRVYPRPVSDVLHIELSLSRPEVIQAELTDITGRSLYDKQVILTRDNEKGRIRTSDLSPGTYLLIIRKESGDILRTLKVPKK